MCSSSYPSHPPPELLEPTIEVSPRPLPPLQTPPLPRALPPLPSPVRDPSFAPSYTVTSHLYPSAYPRAPSTPIPRKYYADLPGETKEQRVTRQTAIVHDLWKQNVAYHKGNILPLPGPEQHKFFWNSINRYVSKHLGQRKGGVTMFLAHANGFPKETWEPFLTELFSRADVVVDEVWAFEGVQHGDSAIVNDSILGNIFDWADNVRDILTFLLYHLPQTASPSVLPTHLPRLPESVADLRRTVGYGTDRILVGVGHSLGGCSTSRVALEFPTLYDTLILVDPVITPRWFPGNDQEKPGDLAVLAVKRRSTWSSRKEALNSFQKSPFFSSWDPATLEKYVKYGLTHDDSSESKDAVRLKMTGVQEATVFIDRKLSYETWELLPGLDPRIEIFYILSGKDTSAVGGPIAIRETVWRRKGNVSNIYLPSVGHLIPQEAPLELASIVGDFLHRKYVSERKAMKALL